MALKIGIDARLYGVEHAGLGRYVMELLDSLKSLDRRNRYTVFLRHPYDQVLRFPENFSVVSCNILHYSFEEQWLLGEIFSRAKLDLLHVPHFNVPLLYRKPFVVTIHDLLWHDIRGLSVTTQNPLVYAVKYVGYLAIVSHALRAAKAIFAPSRVIQKKLADSHGVAPAKIRVTYEAPARIFFPRRKKAEILRKYGITTPFVIYTGSAYPHKNILRLALAVKLLSQRGVRVTLVVASARTVFLNRLLAETDRWNAGKFVRLIGFVPDQDLALLYAHALCLVQPSLSEGFGLTGLEAMACGLPVVANELEIFREIYQDAALFTDARSEVHLADSLQKLLKNLPLQKKLIEAGRKQVKQFSWKKLAEQTLDVYEKVGIAHSGKRDQS